MTTSQEIANRKPNTKKAGSSVKMTLYGDEMNVPPGPVARPASETVAEEKLLDCAFCGAFRDKNFPEGFKWFTDLARHLSEICSFSPLPPWKDNELVEAGANLIASNYARDREAFYMGVQYVPKKPQGEAAVEYHDFLKARDIKAGDTVQITGVRDIPVNPQRKFKKQFALDVLFGDAARTIGITEESPNARILFKICGDDVEKWPGCTVALELLDGLSGPYIGIVDGAALSALSATGVKKGKK